MCEFFVLAPTVGARRARLALGVSLAQVGEMDSLGFMLPAGDWLLWSPTHAAMRLRHGWGTQRSRDDGRKAKAGWAICLNGHPPLRQKKGARMGQPRFWVGLEKAGEG
jgi:hypothetical protein